VTRQSLSFREASGPRAKSLPQEPLCHETGQRDSARPEPSSETAPVCQRLTEPLCAIDGPLPLWAETPERREAPTAHGGNGSRCTESRSFSSRRSGEPPWAHLRARRPLETLPRPKERAHGLPQNVSRDGRDASHLGSCRERPSERPGLLREALAHCRARRAAETAHGPENGPTENGLASLPLSMGSRGGTALFRDRL
jgi:hypothetical protein